MLTDEKIQNIVDRQREGVGLRQSIREVIGEEPTLALLTWLLKNHYEVMTDAKFGNGHATRQADLRQQMKGTG